MKLFYFLLSFIVIFNSCNKKTDFVKKESINNKISSYLEEQINKNENSKDYISEIKDNIIFSTVRVVDYKGTKAIVANLKDVFSKKEVKKLTLDNEEQNHHIDNIFKINKYVLVLYLSSDVIVNGNILKITTNSSDDLIEKNIQKIINIEEDLDFNCDITFRKLNQSFLYQIHYRDDKSGYSVVEPKSKTLFNQNEKNEYAVNNSECIDWFLITTYTFSDGSTYVTEEYIGRTCNNSICEPDPFYETDFVDGYCNENNNQTPPIYIPHKRLCGNYEWKEVGNSHYAILNHLHASFSPNNSPSVIITPTFPDACVNIPDHCLSGTDTFSSYFNNAFNNAVTFVENQLTNNNLPGADHLIKEALKNRIAFELSKNCGGATFNNGGCTGNIPRSNTNYCPN